MFLLEYLTESRLTSRGTAPPLCGGEELTCTCRSLPPVASRLDPRSEPWGETRLCCYLQHLYSQPFVLCAPVEPKLWTHQILMNELFRLKIFTDVHCFICWEQNDVTTINGNQNHQLTEGWVKNHTGEQSKRLKITGWPTLCETHSVCGPAGLS